MKNESTPCPKCSAPSPLVDYAEVDIGVGVQTFNHEYECPTHGCFAFVYDEASHRSKPIFRDEAEATPKPAENL